MYDLYLAQYTHKYGNGYAIIGARNAEQVSSILRNQGRFKDAIIVACKKIELPTPPDGDMQLMIEGAVTTIGNSAYDIAVSLGFKGTKEEWLESMKGPKGDPGPAGSYIAGNGIDITDGVISVIESGSKVSYTPNITEGTRLGTLSVDDKNYNIYSPTPVDAYTKSETNDLLGSKQDTISAGDGIDITNNVVSVDNTVAKAANVYTKTETDSLLNNKQNTLTAGENIDITNNVISIPHVVTIEEVLSPTSNTAINIESSPDQNKDTINITAYGNSADAKIEVSGSGNDNESSLIGFNAYGYNDADVSLYGGREDQPSLVEIYARGSADAYINLTGSLDDTQSRVNIISGGAAEANIQLVGSKEDSPSQVALSAYGYNDSQIELRGATEDHKNAIINLYANGATSSTVMMTGSDGTNNTEIELRSYHNNNVASDASIIISAPEIDNQYSSISVSGDNFTYNNKKVSVDPTNSIFNNNASLTLADNTIYTASEAINTLTLIGTTGTSVVSFDTAASNTVTITLQNIIVADTPTFNNDEHWEIAVRNGYAVFTKYTLS